MQDMAHSICLINLYQITMRKKFRFFVSDYLKQTDTCPIDNIAETKKRSTFNHIQLIKVFRVLSKLKNGKAVGIQNIPNKSPKRSKDIISNSLADIFNESIISNIFPVDFKIGRVTPVIGLLLYFQQ